MAGRNVVAHPKTHAHAKLRMIRLPSFFVECRKNGQVGYGRMFENVGCGLSLAKMAGGIVVAHPKTNAHAKVQVIRLPSIFVKFPNLTKFEVTYSV